MNILKNKTVWTWVAVILGIAVFVFLFSLLKIKNTENANLTNTVSLNNSALIPQSTLDTSGLPKGASINPISYDDALIKYANKRIQFDGNCQAFPNTVTYKAGTSIMIDNRSGEARTINIGVDYSVKAYGFKFITLPNVDLQSKTILIDCDKSQNVATILVQK
jgi:hypothetical protein